MENFVFLEKYIQLLQKVDAKCEWEEISQGRDLQANPSVKSVNMQGLLYTFRRGRAAGTPSSNIPTEVDEKTQTRAIIAHLLSPLRDRGVKAKPPKLVPADLLPAYRELYADFIGFHAPYELNIPEAMIKEMDQYFYRDAKVEPTLICFEAMSAEVIKVFTLRFSFCRSVTQKT